MLIKEIFEKPIDRNIELVIKANNPINLKQEFEEYVVTDEILKYFDLFFKNFVSEINNPKRNCGVWISGFYGSGKSHLLKILSYILDNKFEFESKKPIDFFVKDGKIKNNEIITNMENSINNNDVILFNIASKSSTDKIKDVFIKVFNEMRGYSKDPFFANFENKLNQQNKLMEFKEEFNKNGDWDNERNNLTHIDNFIKSVVNIGYLSKNEAQFLIDSKHTYNQSIEDFAQDVKEYCDEGHRVIFAVDEVGQFISENTNMMLDLQTIVEELSKCDGNAWVIVTSQQQIHDLIKDDTVNDFHKIKSRFNTRINLSSSNVDEIIKWRILDKNSNGENVLKSDYNKYGSTLKNILYFTNCSNKKVYEDSEDFINYYPFIPYQFDLIQKAIVEFRSLNESTLSISEGERSLLEIFQKALNTIKDKNIHALIPLYRFYESFNDIIEPTVAQNMHQAEENDSLNKFDLNVLKTLYLIKYLDDNFLKPTLDNITVLLVSDINEDILTLKKEINESLNRLIEQVYVHKNGDVYYYLTKREQDINLKIKNQQIDSNEIPKEILRYISEDIFSKKKLKLDKQHSYKFNQIIDNEESKDNLTIRYITSYFDQDEDKYQLTLDNDDIINIKHLSKVNNEVVVYLNQNQEIYNELIDKLKIEKFLSDKKLDKSNLIECEKQNEAIEKSNRLIRLIDESIKNSIIYINGDKFNYKKSDSSSILEEAITKLFNTVYNKWGYMTFNPSKTDIKRVFTEVNQSKLVKNDESNNALNDLDEYISSQIIPISLKDVKNKYSDIPYGYVNYDISWLVAVLFSQKRISLLINDEELFLNESSLQNIYNYIIAGKNSMQAQNLFLSKRNSIPKEQFLFVKNWIIELSDYSGKYTDELLMSKFKEIISNDNVKIKDYIREIKRFDKYPGINILEKYKKLSEELLNKNNLKDFYSFINDNKNDFECYIDDLYDVFGFFEGDQRIIFDESCKISEEFNQNEMLINDNTLIDIINQINDKISMENPYEEIKELSNLNKEYYSIFNSILKEEQNGLLESIESDFAILVNILEEDDSLKSNFIDDIENKFSKLKRNLNSDRSIHSIRGKIETSYDLRKKFIRKINKFKEKTEIDVDLNDLFKDEINILNEEDMERFLESIKNELKKELDKNKTIKIINKN